MTDPCAACGAQAVAYAILLPTFAPDSNDMAGCDHVPVCNTCKHLSLLALLERLPQYRTAPPQDDAGEPHTAR